MKVVTYRCPGCKKHFNHVVTRANKYLHHETYCSVSKTFVRQVKVVYANE